MNTENLETVESSADSLPSSMKRRFPALFTKLSEFVLTRPSGWYLGLKSKPSFAFAVLLILFGAFFCAEVGGEAGGGSGRAFGFLIGILLSSAIAWGCERLWPSKTVLARGLFRNRTKAVLNLYALSLLNFMVGLEAVIMEQNFWESQGAGWVFGSSERGRSLLVLMQILVASWVGYQAYLAKRTNQPIWMWIYGSLAVILFPIATLFLSPLSSLVYGVLWLVFLVSSFAFRLPREWPTPFELRREPVQSDAPSSLEDELMSIKRLLDQGILSQAEFDLEKETILRKRR